MKTYKFEISKGELFCLAAVFGYSTLINVVYEPEETGTDLKALFSKISDKLRQKKWLDEDFDGNMSVTDEMSLALSLCNSAKQFWVIQSCVKGDTIADYMYTVYNTSDDYLVLEQVDNDSFKGLLTNDFSLVKKNVTEKTPYSGQKSEQLVMSHSEAKKVLNDESYSIFDIAKYIIDTVDEERTIVCLDISMFLHLKNGGSYLLSTEKNKDGDFLQINQDEYDKELDGIFSIGRVSDG